MVFFSSTHHRQCGLNRGLIFLHLNGLTFSNSLRHLHTCTPEGLSSDRWGWALCVLESQQSLWMYLQTFFPITNFIVSSYSLNFIFLKTQIMQEELLSCGNWCSKIWCSSVLGSCSFFRNVDEVWGAQEVNELKSLYIITMTVKTCLRVSARQTGKVSCHMISEDRWAVTWLF